MKKLYILLSIIFLIVFSSFTFAYIQDDFETNKLALWLDTGSSDTLTRTNDILFVFNGSYSGNYSSTVNNNHKPRYFSINISNINTSNINSEINGSVIMVKYNTCYQVGIYKNGTKEGLSWTGECFGTNGGRLDVDNSAGVEVNYAGNTSCSPLNIGQNYTLILRIKYKDISTREIGFEVRNVTDNSIICSYGRNDTTSQTLGYGWTMGIGSGSGSTYTAYYDDVNLELITQKLTPYIYLVNNTPLNNSFIYYHNIQINTTDINITDYNYTRFLIYYSNMTLYNDYNDTTINATHTFINVPYGTYFIKAVAYDNTNTNITETELRNFTIKNPTSFNVTAPINDTILPYCSDGSLSNKLNLTFNDTNNNAQYGIYYGIYTQSVLTGLPSLTALNGLTTLYYTANYTYNINSWANIPLFYGVNKEKFNIVIVEFPPNTSNINFLTSLFVNYSISSTSFGFCEPNWVLNSNPCINSTELITYYDNRSCNFMCDIPADNGTYKACVATTADTATINATYEIVTIILCIIVIALIIAYKRYRENK